MAHAVALARSRRFEEALHLCEGVLAERPGETGVLLSAGNIAMQLDLFERAADHFEGYGRIEGLSTRLAFDIAYARLLANQPRRALPLLEWLDGRGGQRMLLDYARFLCAGQRIAEVPHGGHVLRFLISGRNLSVDMFLVAGQLFEAEEIALLEAELPPAPRVIDVGANVGVHLLALARSFPDGVFHPVEANPVTERILRRNIELNMATNVRAAGLGKAATAVPTRVSVRQGRDLGRCGVAAGGEIEGVPLDLLVDGGVDLIKIDVEGNEMEVLAGAEALVARCRPKLMVEVDACNAERFAAWSAGHGYRVAHAFAQGGDKSNLFLTAR